MTVTKTDKKENYIVDISHLKFPLLTMGVGLLAGFIGDLLLYSNPLGISIPIFAAVLVIALLGLATLEKTEITWANLWLSVPLLFLSAMSAVRAAPFLRFLNISGALALLALQANRLATAPLITLNIGGYLGAVIETAMLSSIFPTSLVGAGSKTLKESEGSGKMVGRVIVGLLIAAPFLCIFTVLFSSADLIFNKMVQDLLKDINVPDIVGHTILTATLGWIVMGGLAYALTRTRAWRGTLSLKRLEGNTAAGDDTTGDEEAVESIPEEKSPVIRERLGILESSVVLFSIDVLFLVFVVIQFAAHFGGEEFIRSQGLTYSEYARSGFFELLAVALITLSLILALDFATRRESPRQHTVFLVGAGAMIGMTIVILASAFQRLQLYELAYGFTRLRVHSHVFMIWLAVLFVLFLAMLISRKTHIFATGVLIMSLGFVITLDLLNPDVFIVKQNVARYHRGEELDVRYLGSLSEDAVPHLIPLLYEYGPEIGAEAGPWLHYHLNRLDKRQKEAGWPSYHVSINRAYRALDLNRELIEQFELPHRWYGY